MPFTVNDPGHVAEHNRIAQALPPGFVPVPRVTSQPAEAVYAPVLTAQPFTPGAEPWQILLDSFPNTYGPAGTYNRAVHLGWNASRHNGGVPVNGKAAILMGFEDNYYAGAAGESNKYGTEWYVEYWSPDGTSQQMLRPFYARMEGSDTNTASNMTITMDIGSDGTGEVLVKAQGMGALTPLFLVQPGSITLYKNTTHVGNTFTIQPVSGQATVLLNSPVAPSFLFQVSSASAWSFVANSSSLFTIYDGTGRAQLSLTSGANADAAILNVSATPQFSNSQVGSAAAGSAPALPTTPQGYFQVKDAAGVTRKVPYYV